LSVVSQDNHSDYLSYWAHPLQAWYWARGTTWYLTQVTLSVLAFSWTVRCCCHPHAAPLPIQS